LSAAREVAAAGDESAPEGGLLAEIAVRFG
jgi:hypothetical protein